MTSLSNTRGVATQSPPAPPEQRQARLRLPLLGLVVAAVVFAAAADDGGYDLPSRSLAAIAIWWTIVLAVGFGLWPRARAAAIAQRAGVSLAGLALFTGASMFWADSAELAFAEFDRVVLYLGVFLVAVLAVARGRVAEALNGIALGITAIGLVALVTRLVPELSQHGQLDLLPGAQSRLSFPLGYWNGLGIFVALGVPLLFRSALLARGMVGGLIVASIPALASVVYFTSSRGAVATLALATFAFLVLVDRRVLAAVTVLVAGVGAVAAVALLVPRKELANGPVDSAAAASQGHGFAAWLALVCALTGAAYFLARRLVERTRLPARADAWVLVPIVLATLAAIVVLDPVRRIDEFTAVPSSLGERDFVRAHLLSTSGSGRWQFWGAALDQFREAPISGAGAGTFEARWAENGTLQLFARDAHSLWLETLGELGLIGFALLTIPFVLGAVSLSRRLRRSEHDERVTLAALGACFAAFLLAAAVDWIWELTAVGALGLVFLGLAVGPATAVDARPEPISAGSRPPRARFALGVALIAAGWIVIAAQAIPWLAEREVQRSQEAAERGDGEAAITSARRARNIQPWAATPYLQLALVEERRNELRAAREAIEQAIDRNERDWRLWLVSARIETKLGEVAPARRSLSRARELNPRSPLFTRG